MSDLLDFFQCPSPAASEAPSEAPASHYHAEEFVLEYENTADLDVITKEVSDQASGYVQSLLRPKRWEHLPDSIWQQSKDVCSNPVNIGPLIKQELQRLKTLTTESGCCSEWTIKLSAEVNPRGLRLDLDFSAGDHSVGGYYTSNTQSGSK